MQDNATAYPGVLDSSSTSGHLVTTTTFPIIYPWNVSSGFPQGDYWIRVEAYREGFPLDYCYHVLDVAIDR